MGTCPDRNNHVLIAVLEQQEFRRCTYVGLWIKSPQPPKPSKFNARGLRVLTHKISAAACLHPRAPHVAISSSQTHACSETCHLCMVVLSEATCSQLGYRSLHWAVQCGGMCIRSALHWVLPSCMQPALRPRLLL